MLSIARNRVVFLDIAVLNDQGNQIESTEGREPFSYLHGRGNLLPALEKSLDDQLSGFECEVTLAPEDAFGAYRPELAIDIKRNQLSAEVRIEKGQYIQAQGPHGIMEFQIEQIDGSRIRLNANHPLAGRKITFLLKVLAVRKPHKDEVRHRRPHPAGHHLMVAGAVYKDGEPSVDNRATC